MSEAVDVLAIGAHPDDVEIGCGGALILAASSGHRVAVADLTDGEMATRGTPEQRVIERERAAAILGTCSRVSLGLADTGLGRDESHLAAVIGLIRDLRPAIVMAPHPHDRHPDHEAAGRLVRDACFFAGVGKMASGPAHRPRRLYEYMIHHPFLPTFVVDVTPVWTRRMAAVETYASQFGPGGSTEIGNSAFLDQIEARARYFGAMIGAARGEPFFCRGPLAVAQLPELDGQPGLATYRTYL